MLEVSTLRSPSKVQPDFVVGDHHHVVGFPNSGTDDYFMPPVDDNLLLDYIDFSCCDVPLFDADGDILPDLEVDPTDDLLAEFSDTLADDVKLKPPEAQTTKEEAALVPLVEEDKDENNKRLSLEDEKADVTKNNGDNNEVSSTATTEDSAAAGSDTKSSSSAEGHSNKKPAAASGKNSHGKRKVKVDWTPELHRRFVQAVEQLGIDKAVPSRILEIMGIEGLTRHNIASHLQKYRSHRKHLMAREAEAASWAQKRQMYAASTAGVVQVPDGAPAPRKDMPPAGPPWVVPTIGFPPHAAPATAAQPPPFAQPLHVWGHPSVVDGAAPMLPLWPRHLAPPRQLPPWAHPPPVDPAYWHQQYNAARKWGPRTVTQGTPCVPPPMPPAAMRFPVPPVPGMVPHPMYRPVIPPPPPPPPPQSIKLAGLQLQLDAYPSKESIDAAIGEVLVKPWLPLPLGLKPPSLDSVMSELHKQGIPKVPPEATSGS